MKDSQLIELIWESVEVIKIVTYIILFHMLCILVILLTFFAYYKKRNQ
jgi:hypothetical protein